jgi:hypothetical protein
MARKISDAERAADAAFLEALPELERAGEMWARRKLPAQTGCCRSAARRGYAAGYRARRREEQRIISRLGKARKTPLDGK